MKKYQQVNRTLFLFSLGINSVLQVGNLLELNIEDIVEENFKKMEHIKLKNRNTLQNRYFQRCKQSDCQLCIIFL
jgi:hypothetical protein